MSKDYTIVDPGFEFVPPPEKGKELEFLEICTRTCYKSEEHVKPGSAEKLMKKVVSEYKHMSVTEHGNVILRFDNYFKDRIQCGVITNANPLFASRISGPSPSWLVSGNIRMWLELLETLRQRDEVFLCNAIQHVLHTHLPFFFEKVEDSSNCLGMRIIDSNPITNHDNLSPELMKKHMTLTYRLIGTRSMSHQLVRHRLCAFSQESQRYCNYGKKGFQFIIPPSIGYNSNMTPKWFVKSAVASYQKYLELLDEGVKPEDARELLPNCCKTEVVTTCTLDNWAHIIHHRADNPKAQWQIKGIMQGIKEHMYGILPWMDEQEKDGEA